jgi:copper chaperone CopZ
MKEIDVSTQNLSLTDVSTAAPGCACCSTTHHAHTPIGAGAEESSVVATYAVAGMTCGHCVGAVSSELHALDGVQNVQIDLVAGGTSRLTVSASRQLKDAEVSAAITEAGYDLTGRLG